MTVIVVGACLVQILIVARTPPVYTSQALKKRPPCLWAYVDPTIAATCVRKMKDKKEGAAKPLPPALPPPSVAPPSPLPCSSLPSQSKVRTKTSARPDIPVLGKGTQVFVPRALNAECGPRGHVSEWNARTRMYIVTWADPNAAGIRKRSQVL